MREGDQTTQTTPNLKPDFDLDMDNRIRQPRKPGNHLNKRKQNPGWGVRILSKYRRYSRYWNFQYLYLFLDTFQKHLPNPVKLESFASHWADTVSTYQLAEH